MKYIFQVFETLKHLIHQSPFWNLPQSKDFLKKKRFTHLTVLLVKHILNYSDRNQPELTNAREMLNKLQWTIM